MMNYPFVCKRFKNNMWHYLGIIYAKDLNSAWIKATEKFGCVDNVWDLYTLD